MKDRKLQTIKQISREQFKDARLATITMKSKKQKLIEQSFDEMDEEYDDKDDDFSFFWMDQEQAKIG